LSGSVELIVYLCPSPVGVCTSLRIDASSILLRTLSLLKDDSIAV